MKLNCDDTKNGGKAAVAHDEIHTSMCDTGSAYLSMSVGPKLDAAFDEAVFIEIDDVSHGRFQGRGATPLMDNAGRFFGEFQMSGEDLQGGAPSMALPWPGIEP